MTLVTRLTLFALPALALVLVGFSSTLYIASGVQLRWSEEQRVGAILAVLATLAEDGRGGLEWESAGRDEVLARDSGIEGVRWTVRDGDGELIDCSEDRGRGKLPEVLGDRGRDSHGQPWRIERRVLRSARMKSLAPGRSAELVLSAGIGLAPSESTLRNLAITLALLSAFIWGLAALVGRWVCRRALAPLSLMAKAANEIGTDDPALRLPVASTRDELEDLGHAFNGLLDRWHEALERQRRFASDASHQIRTPLTAVLGQVEVALRRDRSPEEYRRVLGLVRDQSDLLRRIVEALLFLARSEPEARPPDFDEIDLVPWIEEQIRRRQDLKLGDAIRWHLPSDASFTVRAQPILLAQIFDNLLDNAQQYSAPGTPVDLRILREGDRVVLSVEDRGIGILPEDLARLFEPFHRSAEARRRNRMGVGLGLAVALRITRAFGGDLQAESQPGLGSRFYLALPSIEQPSVSARGLIESASRTESCPSSLEKPA
jgi:heavy metal sensor kinase